MKPDIAKEDNLEEFVIPKNPPLFNSKSAIFQILMVVFLLAAYQTKNPTLLQNIIIISILSAAGIGGRLFVGLPLRKSLSKAVEEGDVEKVQQILLSGAQIKIERISDFNNSINDKNYWPITSALLRAGASLNMRDKDDCSPLMHLISKDKSELTVRFLKTYKDLIKINSVNKKNQNALMLCGPNFGLEAIKLMIKMGADIYQKDQDGNNALIYAVKNNDLSFVKILVKAGKQDYVNVANKNGETAIIICTKNRIKYDIARYLLKSGADINKEDHEGGSALKLARLNSYYEILKFYNQSSSVKAESLITKPEKISFEDVAPAEDKSKKVLLKETKTKSEIESEIIKNKLEQRRIDKEKSKLAEIQEKEKQNLERQKRNQQKQKKNLKERPQQILALQETKKPSPSPKNISPIFLATEIETDKKTSNPSQEIAKADKILGREIFFNQIQNFLSRKTTILSSSKVLKAMLKGSALYHFYIEHQIEPNDIDFELIADISDSQQAIDFIKELFLIDKWKFKNLKISNSFEDSEIITNLEFTILPEVTGFHLPLNIIIRDKNYPNYPPKDWVANIDALRLILKDLTDKKESSKSQSQFPKLTFCMDLQNKYLIKHGKADVDLLLSDLQRGKYELNPKNLNERRIEKYNDLGITFLQTSTSISHQKFSSQTSNQPLFLKEDMSGRF